MIIELRKVQVLSQAAERAMPSILKINLLAVNGRGDIERAKMECRGTGHFKWDFSVRLSDFAVATSRIHGHAFSNITTRAFFLRPLMLYPSLRLNDPSKGEPPLLLSRISDRE